VDTAASILLVDDEPTIRFYLERLLMREGHQVVAVESGEAAIDCLAAQEFDLALIDLKLKGIDGLHVLAALRAQWPATPAIVLTAHATLETAVGALRQGAHDYLFKPFSTVDLRQSVQAGLLKRGQELQRTELMQRAGLAWNGVPDALPSTAPEWSKTPAASQADGRFLQCQGLIVDPIRHVLTLDGELLELSPTEFSLVAYLVSETPRVVSAQELAREVQGYDCEAREAADTIRTHVYNIRRKIKAITDRDLLRTIRGIGYAVGK
jgi:DNA-binding response OmpR family regulator